MRAGSFSSKKKEGKGKACCTQQDGTVERRYYRADDPERARTPVTVGFTVEELIQDFDFDAEDLEDLTSSDDDDEDD